MLFARLPPVSEVTGSHPEGSADLIGSHNRRLRSLRSLTSGYLPCTPPACVKKWPNSRRRLKRRLLLSAHDMTACGRFSNGGFKNSVGVGIPLFTFAKIRC